MKRIWWLGGAGASAVGLMLLAQAGMAARQEKLVAAERARSEAAYQDWQRREAAGQRAAEEKLAELAEEQARVAAERERKEKFLQDMASIHGYAEARRIVKEMEREQREKRTLELQEEEVRLLREGSH